jgi:hypothetical protein
MSEREAPKPHLLHHLAEDHETELSPELRGVVAEFIEQMVAEYNDRKKGCYDLLKRYPDDEGLKRLWTPYDEGVWQPPRLSASEYLERAYQMADRFNRMFLRTLRQMRDLRRYQMPVTINNPKQVNIAGEGGQQVNVQSKGRGSQKGSGKKRVGRKALAATSGERVNLGKAWKVKARA